MRRPEYSYRQKPKSGFYFLVFTVSMLVAALSSVCSIAMWKGFVPIFFKGAVEKKLIVVDVSYWYFFLFSFCAVVIVVVANILKPFVVALLDWRS